MPGLFDLNQCGALWKGQICRMTSFDERERAFEARLAADQELAFKVAARRNALLGWWAARRMGLSVMAAEEYVKTLVAQGVVHTDPSGVSARVMQDLLSHGVPAFREQLEAQIQQLTAKARAEIVRGELSR